MFTHFETTKSMWRLTEDSNGELTNEMCATRILSVCAAAAMKSIDNYGTNWHGHVRFGNNQK